MNGTKSEMRGFLDSALCASLGMTLLVRCQLVEAVTGGGGYLVKRLRSMDSPMAL
jgi:hypothetical protein